MRFPTKEPMIHVLEGPKDAAKRIETVLRMKARRRPKSKWNLRKLFKWLDKNMLRIFNDDKKEKKKDFDDDKRNGREFVGEGGACGV